MLTKLSMRASKLKSRIRLVAELSLAGLIWLVFTALALLLIPVVIYTEVTNAFSRLNA